MAKAPVLTGQEWERKLDGRLVRIGQVSSHEVRVVTVRGEPRHWWVTVEGLRRKYVLVKGVA